MAYIKFVKDTGKKTLQKIIRGKIVLEKVIFIQILTAYNELKKKEYKHETIDHNNEEYFKQKDQKKYILTALKDSGDI